MQAIPHLNFKGNCREAFKEYAEILGGRIVFSMTYGETPMGGQVSQDQRDRIAHARLDFGGRAILGADPPAEHYHQPAGFSLMVEADDPAEAERVFNALAKGGTITMPFGETFWARRFGGCVDRFGIPWMVNCGKPLDSLKSRGT
ncbi:MAG TPA: VOC family protein [Steroidobacteraceae bacterium]|nr:VOC family protein [Steroidobacteraceae bacterium]